MLRYRRGLDCCAAWMRQSALKTLLIARSAFLALALSPSVVVCSLRGSALDSSVDIIVARIAGAALVIIGIACWPARNGSRSPAATGLIVATLCLVCLNKVPRRQLAISA
jgi:hypothetical protein